MGGLLLRYDQKEERSMNFTAEEITVITKVLIRTLIQDENALAAMQQELQKLKAEQKEEE